ncbi:MAG: glycosyltransferase family 2 protein [Elusimicrobiaceae bacterium]|nr:glycosyltransferase family 2 protein [Elusimicrobiaceae bacterium]
MPKLSLVIPTLNNALPLAILLDSARRQTLPPDEIIVIDSSSDDDTAAIAGHRGARVIVIPRADFDHGGTRTAGGKAACGDIVLFMTDDALPADTCCFEKLLLPFADPAVAAVYGRQLPAENATPLASHLRHFNYPPKSCRRRWEDRARWGLKTAFLSNSFCAYRKNALAQAGWFREDIIIAEDMCAGLQLLKRGGTLCYNAEACVYHSHNLPVRREFSRYFDIGVMHALEKDVLAELGRAEGEGKRYALSALSCLSVWRYPEFFARAAAKYAGYLLGKNCRLLPRGLILKLSLNPGWWRKYGT